MQVSRSKPARSPFVTLNHASRINRELLSPSCLGAPKPSQESLFFFAEASSLFVWGRLSDHIGRKPVLMTASGCSIWVFVHDAKSCILGYGRTRYIHDQFRSLQDL